MLAAVFALLVGIDLAGNSIHLADSKPAVLVFVRTDCPISNRYAPELNRLYREYAGHADFYLVYADPSETTASIRKHMSEYGYQFHPLRDPGFRLARRAKASVTPEAALFSPNGELLYHGRIDDRYVDFGKSLPEPTRHDLEEALQSTLAGKPIKETSTRAIGCFLADIQ